MKKIKEISENIELFDLYKNTLTEKQKNTFKMYYFDDMTFQEIADELNLGKATVQQTVRKVNQILKRLEKEIGFLKYIKNENKN